MEQSPGPMGDFIAVQFGCNGSLLCTIIASCQRLAGASSWMEARLSSNWQPVGAKQHILQLTIEKEELDAATAMLQHMQTSRLPQRLYDDGSEFQYDNDAAAADAQKTLRQLLGLAEYYQAEACINDALLALADWVRSKRVRWSTVVYLLEEVALDTIQASPAYAAARTAAKQCVQATLCDLEAVARKKRLTQRLVSLPCCAFVELLGASNTRVASEATVVDAINNWLMGKPEGYVSNTQLQQLASRVRLRGTSKVFRDQVLFKLDWYKAGAAPGILGCLEPILDMVPPLPSAAITSHKSSVADEAVQQTKGLSRALSHMMQRCTPGTSEWLEEALQEPRRPSRITALSLDGRISAECIRRKFAERHGYSCDSPAGRSKWVSVSAAVFAGLRFTLHFRFILAKAPGGSSTMQAAASRKRARFEPQEPQQPQPQPHHHQQQQPQAGAAAAASSSSSSSSGSSSNMDGSSGGSGRMCWLLQFGVSFTVPCLPKGSTPLFGIQRPMLQQPPGFSLSGGRVTRQQTAQHGCDISQQGVLLQARSVLPCADVLPVYLPDADWGMEHSSQLAPFVTGGDDVLEVKVLVQPPK